MRSYIEKIIYPFMQSTNVAPLYSVAVRVQWELENFLEQEHNARDDIGDIMILTGKDTRAQALPCGEYMQQSWPHTGKATLAAVRDALQRGYSCEYPRSFPIGSHALGDKSVPLGSLLIDFRPSIRLTNPQYKANPRRE